MEIKIPPKIFPAHEVFIFHTWAINSHSPIWFFYAFTHLYSVSVALHLYSCDKPIFVSIIGEQIVKILALPYEQFRQKQNKHPNDETSSHIKNSKHLNR